MRILNVSMYFVGLREHYTDVTPVSYTHLDVYKRQIQCNLQVEKQKALPIIYKGIKVDAGYRLDIVVNNSVVVELKAVEELHPLHTAQLITYLKLSHIRHGLLINFNVKSLKEGIKRYIV